MDSGEEGSSFETDEVDTIASGSHEKEDNESVKGHAVPDGKRKEVLSRKEKRALKRNRKAQAMRLEEEHRTPVHNQFKYGRKSRAYKRENFNHSRRTRL